MRRNEWHLVRFNEYMLYYNHATKSLEFTSQMESYNPENLVRIRIDDKGQFLLTYHVQGEAATTVQAPENILNLIFKFRNHETSTFRLANGFKVLSNDFAQHNDLDSFLNFFMDGSFLCFTGEYGYEIITYLPFIAFLVDSNQLGSRKVQSYRGMEPYYFFVPKDIYFEVDQKRVFVANQHRLPVPNSEEHKIKKKIYEKYPDFRDYFSKNADGKLFKDLDPGKEILFIQNKFTVEWHRGPINYLPIVLLIHLFINYSNKYNIIYSRPQPKKAIGYSQDENIECDYPDINYARQNGIVIFEEILTDLNYNTKKLMLMSKCNKFITVQGGGSYLIPFFKDSRTLILHIEGQELEQGSYLQNGFFQVISNNNSEIIISRDHNELWKNIIQNF